MDLSIAAAIAQSNDVLKDGKNMKLYKKLPSCFVGNYTALLLQTSLPRRQLQTLKAKLFLESERASSSTY
jgi:hypothetical protein